MKVSGSLWTAICDLILSAENDWMIFVSFMCDHFYDVFPCNTYEEYKPYYEVSSPKNNLVMIGGVI